MKIKKADLTKIILATIFMIMVFVPLLRMFAYMDRDSIGEVISSPNFGQSISNSVLAATIATIITVGLAYIAAVSTERIAIKGKILISVIFTLPMLIPSISHGMGLVFLLGNNGILTNLLGFQSGIYGLKGIVIGSVMYAFPVAYLMLSDVMKYEDCSPYEAANVLGISPFRRFMRITMPYLRKPLISVVFAIFTLVITDYGVPLMVGGKYVTIPVVMYQEVIGQLNFGKGTVYGTILLFPAILAFLVDLCNQDKGNSNYINRPFIKSNKLKNKVLSYCCCITICVFILLPICAFLLLAIVKNYPKDLSFTWENFSNAIAFKADQYLLNSLLIALIVSVIGVIVAFFTAYLSARMHSKTSRFLHLSAILTAAIPGIVLGLSYVLCFKGSFLKGTLLILVMVNMVHFMSSPYLMMYNSLSKLNENLESVGQTLGIERTYMIRDVFIPTCSKTIAEMFTYFFVNCMMTISAVSFLATTANKPVALMINQFEAQSQLESAAIVSLMILMANLCMKAVMYKIKRKLPV